MNTKPVSDLGAMADVAGGFSWPKRVIRGLSAPAEFCLVLFVGFGLFIAGPVWVVMKSRRLEINNAGCITVSVAELLILSVVLWIGKLRGWSLKTFGSEVSWKGTGAGMLLFIAAQLGMAGVGIGAQMLHPEQVRVSVGHLAVPLVLLLSIVNPIFEEVLEVGYFIHSFRRFGRWPAVLASALFRASLHWWLGVNGVLAILALGVLLGFAYWRWRQLWPLVVAHWLCDMLGGIMGWA